MVRVSIVSVCMCMCACELVFTSALSTSDSENTVNFQEASIFSTISSRMSFNLNYSLLIHKNCVKYKCVYVCLVIFLNIDWTCIHDAFPDFAWCSVFFFKPKSFFYYFCIVFLHPQNHVLHFTIYASQFHHVVINSTSLIKSGCGIKPLSKSVSEAFVSSSHSVCLVERKTNFLIKQNHITWNILFFTFWHY